MKYRDYLVSIVCFIALVVVMFIVTVLNPTTTTNTPPYHPEWNLQVQDRPLLTEEQKNQVVLTDSISFKVGNECVIIQSGARKALEGYY